VPAVRRPGPATGHRLVGVETWHWEDREDFQRLDRDLAPDGLATDRDALHGPIPRGATGHFCEPLPATAMQQALGASRSDHESQQAVPRKWLPAVQEPFDAPVLAEAFGESDPEVYLRYGETDACNPNRGFGLLHIEAKHGRFTDRDEASVRHVLQTGYVSSVEPDDSREGVNVVVVGPDQDGVSWRIVVASRVPVEPHWEESTWGSSRPSHSDSPFTRHVRGHVPAGGAGVLPRARDPESQGAGDRRGGAPAPGRGLHVVRALLPGGQ